MLEKQQIIPFDMLSNEALDGTLSKWYKTYMGKQEIWSTCQICIEVCIHGGGERWNCQVRCPLAASNWCNEVATFSRLSKECVLYDNTTQHEQLENYLTWISIELEMRRAKYEGWI